ncbi:Oidioi.mRNA.OKI2018_I69.chr1.g1775.t2.cds [Oikopleura dioica]|uniref:Oidioi.mRNA.OKI2018_I69.chr1.g1775.t2.cds n=1 Tax=Oikopleura dioica TaxID=34765 RepID=A0ABN7SU85_OIKDI|nr:Oidioi.mRNA.OKI2018_I69.chr1.g1775.t2.cds [Oikopleura dioica]
MSIFKGRLTTGIKKLATRLVGPNKLIQAAIPKILSIPVSWHNEQNTKLEEAADLFYDGIMQAPGLIPIMPSGAMYMMVKIDFSRLENFSDDMHFCQTLVSEKSVFVLPGSCFGFPNFFRVVIRSPRKKFQKLVNESSTFATIM